MIEGKNIVKKFKSGNEILYAVNDITLKVKSGEFVAITGRSGSGKSTLMYQLGLLDKPDSGTIIIDGQDTSELDEETRTNIRLNFLGYIFQDYALLPDLTAQENVLVPLLMQGLPRVLALAKAENALKRVGLSDRMDHLPSQLSGGQQQRVSIARAVAHDPKIIFADEPTANLDSESSSMVLKNFLALNKEGQTILLVTHEEEYIRQAERVIVISDGKIANEYTNKI